MRILATVVLGLALGGLASASDTDTFAVQGTDPDGGAYTGTVTLTELHPDRKIAGDVFDVVWDVGGQKIVGVGIVDGANRNVLAVAYDFQGAPGVAIMTQEGETAKGVWYVKGAPGAGTEIWTPQENPEPPAAAAIEITYDRAVTCAAATSFVTGMLRATPGAEAAAIQAYDAANSAWIVKLGEVGKDKAMSARIADIRARQQEWAADPDGLAKATPVADDCVMSAPPM